MNSGRDGENVLSKPSEGLLELPDSEDGSGACGHHIDLSGHRFILAIEISRDIMHRVTEGH
jgi:hypothetical protein